MHRFLHRNSVPVARMGSATTSQHFIRQMGAALGVSPFVLSATVGGFRLATANRDQRRNDRVCARAAGA